MVVREEEIKIEDREVRKGIETKGEIESLIEYTESEMIRSTNISCD